MGMNLIISFPGTAQTTLAEVGGKGWFLIRMVAAGLPVPPGAVLTTEFLEPWFDEIKASTCVVGIDGLMTKLCDGQKVEVNGTAGVIRLLS